MTLNHTNRRSQSKILASSPGFTMVELLIVMVVIGLLAGLLLTNFAGARQRSRDSARKYDLNQLKSALRLYYNDYQAYPLNGGSGNAQIMGCGATGTSACTWGNTFSAGSGPTQYMQQMPIDPLDSGSYVYSYTQISDDEFELEATLENNSDQDAAKSQLRCDPAVTSLTDPDIVNNRYLVCED